MTQGLSATLRQMIEDLRYYQFELEQAQERRDYAVRADLQHMIGIQSARIREYCAEYGLTVPLEVPLPN